VWDYSNGWGCCEGINRGWGDGGFSNFQSQEYWVGCVLVFDWKTVVG